MITSGIHNARNVTRLRIVGVGSSSDANSEQATAAKAMGLRPSVHAVAIQKNAQTLIATAAARADNSAMPGSACMGFGPTCAAAARISALGVFAGSAR